MLASHLSQPCAQKAPLKLPILSPGSSGSTVRVLQQLLNFKGFKIEVNGEFGSRTLEAVKNFQKANGLSVNGIVDSKTWQHLSFGLLELSC